MADIPEIPDDDIFSLHITDNMELRNKLRGGLVEAQGNDSDKIPMFVSWPAWLDDGIVCLYARDFKNVLRNAIKDTVVTINSINERSEEALPDTMATEQVTAEIQNDSDEESDE